MLKLRFTSMFRILKLTQLASKTVQKNQVKLSQKSVKN